MVKPMEYLQTTGMGDGLSQCSIVQHHTRTHTHHIHDQNTVGIPVPMKYPSHSQDIM